MNFILGNIQTVRKDEKEKYQHPPPVRPSHNNHKESVGFGHKKDQKSDINIFYHNFQGRNVLSAATPAV